MNEFRAIVLGSFRIFFSRNGRLLSGAIAFYALLSIVPMLVVALRVAAFFAGEGEASSALSSNLARWVGADGAEALLGLMARSRAVSGGSHLSLFASAVLLYGSTRLFSQMKRALDILWNAEDIAVSGMKAKVARTIQRRVLSFALVVFLGFTIVAMVIVHALLERLRMVNAPFDVSRATEFIGSVVLTFVLFSLVFTVLPDRRVPIREALMGAMATALLFCIGSYGVSAYAAHKAGESIYGAFSVLVMLLLWVHYSAHVFFFGASIAIAFVERPKFESE